MSKVDLQDPELTAAIGEINRWHGHAARQVAEGLDGALFLTLMQLEAAARRAQERLNRLRWDGKRERVDTVAGAAPTSASVSGR